MQIWDSGWYELLRETDFDAALASGELKLMVRGRRLRGEWHMVRTSRDNADAQEEWLLFKARDGYARDADELVPAIDTDLARAALELLATDVAAVRAEHAVLDERNRPDRDAAHRWARGEANAGLTISYNAFDLLYYDEWDVRPLALVDRKHLLRALIPPRPGLLYVDHVAGSGAGLAASAAAAGFHSLIAKRGASTYRSGPQPAWRRIAVAADQDAADLELNEALARSKAGRASSCPTSTRSTAPARGTPRAI